MFATIVLLTIGLIIFLSIREWLQYCPFSKRSVENTLKHISELIVLEKWKEAEKALDPLLCKGLGGKKTLLLHAQVLQGTERHEQALHLVMDASSHYPEDLRFRREEGKILLAMGQPLEALEAFKVCAPILRKEKDLLIVAQAYYQSGCFDLSLEVLQPLLSQTQNEGILTLAADSLFNLKKHLVSDRKNPCSYLRSDLPDGQSAERAGSFKQAVKREHEAQQDKDGPKIGADFCDQTLKAILLYKKALKLTNHPRYILNQLAHAYLQMGKIDEAEKRFRQILKRDSSDSSATLGLGACMQMRNMPQKALLIYQAGKAWEKKDPQILHQAGICALRSQKYKLATNYFSQVLCVQGPSPELLSYYGLSLECQRRWQEAEQNYFKFIELFPSESHGYRSLAWLFGVGLSSSVSLEQGYNFACVSLKLSPGPSSWEIMSACEARKGNFSRAHQILEHLLSSDNDSRARVRRQQAMRNLRKNLPLADQHVQRGSIRPLA